MTAKTVIDLKAIDFVRDERFILRGVNWRVRRGEHWALLGANGSGKTTLLQIVCGYRWPNSGSVRVLGNQYGETEIAEVRKQIGWVSSALTEWIPGDNSALAVAVSGLEASFGLWREFKGREMERARREIEALGGGELAEKPYIVLSQGERQRVLIARALINRPRILILDEPCAGLDPAAREHFLHDLERSVRRASAPSIIFVTHHIEEIPAFVDKGLLLKDGRIVASGALARIMTSKNMSEALGSPCTVQRNGVRYSLCVGHAARGKAGDSRNKSSPES